MLIICGKCGVEFSCIKTGVRVCFLVSDSYRSGDTFMCKQCGTIIHCGFGGWYKDEPNPEVFIAGTIRYKKGFLPHFNGKGANECPGESYAPADVAEK